MILFWEMICDDERETLGVARKWEQSYISMRWCLEWMRVAFHRFHTQLMGIPPALWRTLRTAFSYIANDIGEIEGSGAAS
jgi:hypothetical protein